MLKTFSEYVEIYNVFNKILIVFDRPSYTKP